MDDQTLALPQRQPVTLRVARASRVLGLPLTQPECSDVFRRLGLSCAEGPGTLTVTPPSWRFDLSLEEDLIEEVVRVIGLQRLPQTPPLAPVTAQGRPEGRRTAWGVRHALAALGYQETISFSFVEERSEHELAGNPNPIRVLNPIAAPLAVMRSSLIGSLVQVLKTNLARRASRVRVFEVGRVFWRDDQVVDTLRTVAGVNQPTRVAGLLYGAVDGLQWGTRERAPDFFDIKGDVEALLAPRVASFVADSHPALHPGRCARVELDGRVLGYVGELHPRWRQAYDLPQAPLVFELDLDGVLERPLPQFKPLPKQQSALRDLALVVDERVPHDRLIEALLADPMGLVKSAVLFDIYKPAAGAAVPGLDAAEHSLAIRLELQDDVSTLTDERIEVAMQQALQRANSGCGARLRS